MTGVKPDTHHHSLLPLEFNTLKVGSHADQETTVKGGIVKAAGVSKQVAIFLFAACCPVGAGQTHMHGLYCMSSIQTAGCNNDMQTATLLSVSSPGHDQT